MSMMALSLVMRSNLLISENCMITNVSGEVGKYNWEKSKVGNLDASFYYGYLVTQVFGGALSYKFGPSLVICCSMIGASISTICFPFMADLSYGSAVASRIFLGVFLGMIFTSVFQVVSAWVPEKERGKLIGLIEMGSPIGIILTHPLSIELCLSSSVSAWKLSFYVPGLLGLILSGICFIFLRSRPSDHHYISQTEKRFLETNISEIKTGGNIQISRLFRNKALYGFYIGFSLCEFFNTVLSMMVWTLIIPETSANLRAELYPVLVFWIAYMVMIPIYGFVADAMVSRGVFSLISVRKISVCLGCLLSAIITVVLGVIGRGTQYWTLKIVLWLLSHAAFAAHSGAGIYCSANDMAPEYAGAVWGIANTMGTIVSLVIVNVIKTVQENSPDAAWNLSMYGSAAANTLAAIAFCTLARAHNVFERPSFTRADTAETTV
ncbi:hypothetical protein ACOME3_006141 [Neoechinorhynchus agilis]